MIALTEDRLREILDEKLARFEIKLLKTLIDEARAREIVRDELTQAAERAWDRRSKVAGVGMLFISVSTFLLSIAFHVFR